MHQREKQFKLGYILDSYDCCNIKMDIFDHDNQWQYRVSTPWCQCGIQCKGDSSCCLFVEFIISDANGDEISRLKRKEGGGISNLEKSDMEQFRLAFTNDMPWNHRTLLLSAQLAVEERYFAQTNYLKTLKTIYRFYKLICIFHRH